MEGEHFDPSVELGTSPTAEIDLGTIKRRSITGVLALTSRTFFLQIVTLVSTFALTVFLDPRTFGVFFLVSAVINFFAYFSDIGLAAALIQRKEKLKNVDLRTTFAVQQGLVLLLLAIIFAATPFIRGVYNLGQEGIWLLWALAFSLFLASLKTIPSVLLERELDFNKLVIPQIAETIIFYLAAVYLAWQGFGITSFTVAVLLRGFTGLILIYILRPWRPGFAFSRDSLRGLLRFGLPYQANTFLAMAKDDGMTAVLGVILGPAGIGLLGWAQKWAQAPLRFFMDQVIKVTFPAFSRMQDDKKELSQAVSRALFFVSLLVFPSLVGLVLVAPVLVEIIPRYEKWQPALLALSLISINSAWAAVTTPLTNVFNAIGKITITFRLMIMWTVLTWLLLPALALLYGVNGAAFGFSLVGASSIIAIWLATKYVSIAFWESIGKPLVGAGVMGLVVFWLKTALPASTAGVLLLVGTGIVSYALFIYLLVGPSLLADVKKILAQIKAR